MQTTKGLRSVLSIASLYSAFQTLAGARYSQRWLAQNYWKLRTGDKVVDIGCGPGTILEALPPTITYVGLDISEAYVRAASERYHARGAFITGTASQLADCPPPEMCGADLVMCTGLLHHLNDYESLDVFRLAREILKPSGRMVCFEPTYLVHQRYLSKWLMSKDRGRNVRSEKEWKRLVAQVFPDFESGITTGLLKLPYVHIIIECRNNGPAWRSE